MVVGWKVGYIVVECCDGFGDECLLGLIFKCQFWNDIGGISDILVFVGGFGVVEVEYVLELLEDVLVGQLYWFLEQVEVLFVCFYIGVEVVSSLFVIINEFGLCVVVVDFGNNNGLVLGLEIVDWIVCDENLLCVEILIEGEVVGIGGVICLFGGLWVVYVFVLFCLVLCGWLLCKGDLIVIGNVIGIYDIEVG